MPSKVVRKAVIPAAGFGTRMYPATKVIKKELMPIIDGDGRAKPIILAIVEEAISAGIEEVAIVVQQSDRDLFNDLFKSPPKPELAAKLSPDNLAYTEYLQSIGDRITILTQPEQMGFGHAVFCAQDWINNQPFLLLLGDHVYTSNLDISCAKQMVDIYQKVGTSIIGITVMNEDIIHKAGCIFGDWTKDEFVLEIKEIYEKPTLEYARQHLHVTGMPDNQYLGIFGMYILESDIFDLLTTAIKNQQLEAGEFQLTSCLAQLNKKYGAIAYQVQGQYYDTGMPLFYRQTMIDYYKKIGSR